MGELGLDVVDVARGLQQALVLHGDTLPEVVSCALRALRTGLRLPEVFGEAVRPLLDTMQLLLGVPPGLLVLGASAGQLFPEMVQLDDGGLAGEMRLAAQLLQLGPDLVGAGETLRFEVGLDGTQLVARGDPLPLQVPCDAGWGCAEGFGEILLGAAAGEIAGQGLSQCGRVRVRDRSLGCAHCLPLIRKCAFHQRDCPIVTQAVPPPGTPGKSGRTDADCDVTSVPSPARSPTARG
ncbi:hypothetical protein ACFWG0_35140 [Streptomyces yangpuensis]|uniref:hypothetical protein n=1 Tax=Streptomyces yangpuensis TaxID=1648182 RepID=UPI0036546C72